MTDSLVRRAAVLGHPIAHSLSPVLHRAAYAALGLPWTYEAVDVEAEGLPSFVRGRGPDWVGLSLTMPLKEAVLPLLDRHSPIVELTRAANTVVLDGGDRVGHNTDVAGLVDALHEADVVSVDSAAILGSGATARSAVVALQQLGARELDVVARPGASVDALASLAATVGVRVRIIGWDEAARALARPIVVSTVPASVAAGVVGAVPPLTGVLFDVIYDPWPTPLAAAWGVSGRCLGGIDLLVHQACGQVELMTGSSVAPQVLRQALDDHDRGSTAADEAVAD